MKAAVCYARVSTQGQVDNFSIPTQLEEIYRYASDNEYQIIEEFIEPGESASTLDRPALNDLREKAKKKQFECVVVHDVDRFSRVFMEQLIVINELETLGIEVRFVLTPTGKTPEEKMLFNVKSIFAEYERCKTLERTSRGRRARLNTGKLMGGACSRLYGYDYVDGKRQFNSQTEIVRDIWKWFTVDNLQLGTIINALKAKDIPSPTGLPHWSKSCLLKLLKNPAYMGITQVRLQGVEAIDLPDATPAIIDEQTFNIAQEKLTRNKELAQRNRKHQYLLSGFIRCKRDGRRYIGTSHKGIRHGKERTMLVYRCGKAYEPIRENRCHNRRYSAAYLDKLVWDRIIEDLSDVENVKQALNLLKEDTDKNILLKELNSVERGLRQVDTDQRKLLQWAMSGFPEDMLQKENERLNQQRADLESRKSELQNRLEVAQRAEVDTHNLERACKLIRENAPNLSFEQKRELLRTLEITIWVDSKDVLIEGTMPIEATSIVTTPSRPRLSPAHPPCP